MANYYKTPPEDYKEYKVIDATNKKVGLTLNLIALLLTVGLMVGLYFLLLAGYTFLLNDLIVFFIVMVVGYVLYIITHELLHGLAYKLLTKQKLTFEGRRLNRSPFKALWGMSDSPSMSRSRRVLSLFALSPMVAQDSSNAVAIPTMAGRFSVPALLPRSCAPPSMRVDRGMPLLT